MKKTILICGLGRSGTNILLDSLGLSGLTHCRNEPQAYPESPYKKLIVDNPEISSGEQIANNWHEALEWMESHWGDRDRIHPNAEPKVYFQNWAWKLGIVQFILKKQKIRKGLSILFPSLSGLEFQLPSWLLTKLWQTQTVNVLKTMDSTDKIMPWLLKNNPDTRVVLIIRHPLGFAQSLYKRFYTKKSEAELNSSREKNIQLLKKRFESAKANGFQLPSLDFDSLDLFESVVWGWLFFNEISYQLYKSEPSVKIVCYEEILANPVKNLQSVFNHVELPWNDQIQAVISEIYSQSAKLGTSFRSFWDPAQCERVEQILQSTQVKELWTADLWQNLEQMSESQSGQLTYDPFK
jgi:Sulfotransferase domain